MRVGLVQGNVEQGQKWNPALGDKISSYLRLSRDVVRRGAQLVVWPESSTPFLFEEDPAAEAIRRLARETDARSFGSDQVERGTPPRYFNSAFLVSRPGRSAGIYRKMQLVPFGEYVPFKTSSLRLAVVDRPATSRRATPYGLPLARAPITTAICYEVVFPELARGAVHRRQPAADDPHQRRLVWPELGAVSALPRPRMRPSRRALPGPRRQHRHQRHRRSLRPVGRASALFERDRDVGEVRLLDGRTVYARIGDVFAWTLVVALALSRSQLPAAPSRVRFAEPRGDSRATRHSRRTDPPLSGPREARRRAAELSLTPHARGGAARIEARVGEPDFWKDQAEAQKFLQRRRRLEEDVDARRRRWAVAPTTSPCSPSGSSRAKPSTTISRAGSTSSKRGRDRRGQEDARRRARSPQRDRDHPSGRGRHRVAGLGRDAPAHVSALGRDAAASRRDVIDFSPATKPASSRRRRP